MLFLCAVQRCIETEVQHNQADSHYKFSLLNKHKNRFNLMKRRYTFFVVTALFSLQTLAQTTTTTSATATTTTDTTSKPITLQQCIQLAVDNSFAVLRAKNQADVSGWQLLQSYGQFLPNLNVSAGYTPISTANSLQSQFIPSPDTTRPPQQFFVLQGSEGKSANYNISSSLNLFNGFSDFSGLKRALNQRDAAVYTVEQAKQDIAFNVAQSYLQVLLNDELLRIAQENLRASQGRLRQLQEQTKVGSRAVADLYQQESQTAANELSVIRAENTLRNSKITLLRQIRLDPAKEYAFQVPESDTTRLDNSFQNIDRLLQEAARNRYDLKAREQSLNAAVWGTRGVIGSGYLPRVDLNFNYGANGFTQDRLTIAGVEQRSPVLPALSQQLRDQNRYSLSISMNWTIFDRFSRELQVQQTKLSEKNAAIDYEDLKLQIIGQVKQGLGDYNAAVLQMTSTEKGLISSTQAYETVKKRYEVGSATFVELATAQADLVQAQSNRAQALFNFTFQKKILEYFTGALKPESFGVKF
jgi:outer membrane protein